MKAKYVLSEAVTQMTVDQFIAKAVQQGVITKLDSGQLCLLVSMDPTAKEGFCGKYAKFIANNLYELVDNEDGMIELRINDFIKALKMYTEFKQRKQIVRFGLSPNIESYESVSDFVNAVFEAYDSNDQNSNSLVNKMKLLTGQYDVFYQDDEWFIVCPKSYEAERFFGQGTSWCTVANNTYFEKYKEGGKLYINIPKVNGRVNIHSRNKSQFFMGLYDCTERGYCKSNIYSFAGVNDDVCGIPEEVVYKNPSWYSPKLFQIFDIKVNENLLNIYKNPHLELDGLGLNLPDHPDFDCSVFGPYGCLDYMRDLSDEESEKYQGCSIVGVAVKSFKDTTRIFRWNDVQEGDCLIWEGKFDMSSVELSKLIERYLIGVSPIDME